MEASRPRPSILSLFDPLSLTPELDKTASTDSDKENNDTSDFFRHQHIHVPPHTLKRRLVDVGDTTVEHPDIHALLSDELEQELSYIVNDDDDENDTLTFRDIAQAATPKWSSRNSTALETPEASSLFRSPLAEISLKDELTPLARKKPYKRQLVPTKSSKGAQSACLIFSPLISAGSSSGCPPYAKIPEVRINDQLVPQSSSIPTSSLGNSSESSSSRTMNQSTPTETLVCGPFTPVVTLPSSHVAPAPSRAQTGARHLSPTSPTEHANRYSVDLQTSFQVHFPSHDTTFDLIKDKISFFGCRNEFDFSFNSLEGDSSLDDDISIPEPKSKIERESRVSSTITLDQAQSAVKSVNRLIDHPTPVSKDVGEDVTKPSEASPSNIDASSLIQPSIFNLIDNIPSLVADTNARATFVRPHTFHTPSSSPPLPFVADNSHPLSTPNSFTDNPRHPPPHIPALRIVKRSKTITQQKPSTTTKDGPLQDALIPVGSHGPVTEATVSSSITKKGHMSEVSQVRRTDKVHLPPSLGSNGPRRVLISEGPKLNLAPNTRASASLEQVKPSSFSGPRRVPMAAPPRGASSSARPPIQPSSGLRQPVKYGTSIVKPVQRTAGSRLPAMTRRIGVDG